MILKILLNIPNNQDNIKTYILLFQVLNNKNNNIKLIK